MATCTVVFALPAELYGTGISPTKLVHLKGCYPFHTFFQGKWFSCVAFMYLAVVTKHRMLASHPIWPFWTHPFSFFEECDSILVKPRITTSSGEVQQSIVDLTKGMSPVSGCDQKKEQIQKIQMSSTPSRHFSSYVPSLLHNHCSFVCRVCFRGAILFKSNHPHTQILLHHENCCLLSV